MITPFRNNLILSIPQMHDIALRFIFDKKSVRPDERVALEESITVYSKIVDLNRGDKVELKRIVNALIANEKGYFDRSKEIQARDNIHYRQLYKAGLPFIQIDGRTSWNKS